MHFVLIDLISVPVCDSYSQPAFGVMFVMSVLIQNLEESRADFIKNSYFSFVKISIHSVIKQTCPEVAELKLCSFQITFPGFQNCFLLSPNTYLYNPQLLLSLVISPY